MTKINGVVSARRIENRMCDKADKEQAEKADRMYNAETKNQITEYLMNRLGYGKAQDIKEKANVLHRAISLHNDMRVDLQRELDKYEVKWRN